MTPKALVLAFMALSALSWSLGLYHDLHGNHHETTVLLLAGVAFLCWANLVIAYRTAVHVKKLVPK